MILHKLISFVRRIVAILITIFDFNKSILSKLIPENFLNDLEEYNYYSTEISNFIFKIKWDVLNGKLEKIFENKKDNL